MGGGEVSGTGGAGGAGGASSSAGPAAPVFHVFLLLGQSNMAGYPKASNADKTENPRIKVLGFDDCAATGRVEGEWDIAAPPLHECWNGAIGPGDYFAKTILDRYPAQDSIGLVPSALSGEKVETFMKAGGSKYDWILSRAKAAQEAGGVIEGILFHQGESNCGDPAWPGKVRTLVSDLRADLGLGDVPFLAGELLYSGSCARHNSLVGQLPGLVANAHVVSAEGLAIDPADTWNLHFGHDALVTLGIRYAEKMSGVLGL
ncbi:dockerin-like protein [Sorangium cellulosum]|uniref:Dockerin-like protein n=1 Tax=Sorangium cellulosum TaxID=56 RepID=A0A150PG01_SORCE|nr:dockerin-like protein [Sorangium cellulosum]